MAKKGMARPERTHELPQSPAASVPELGGKAKHGKETARSIVSGTEGAGQKVFHTDPPIPAEIYPVIDTDLGRDNVENDLPAADRNEL